MKVIALLIVLFGFSFSLLGQDMAADISGRYAYSVVDTPYGDFFGWIILRKNGNTYKGEIIDEEGKQSQLKVIRSQGTQLEFRSNLEDSKSLFICSFFGDSVWAEVRVDKDDFKYILKGKKVVD